MIKKNDSVYVIAGKDRGVSGTVTKALPKKGMVFVSGVNIQKRHHKPRKSGEKGQIIEKPMPIHVSNVMIIDPDSKKPSRIGRKKIGDNFVRISKKSGKEL